VLLEGFEPRALERSPGQRVLDDLVGRLGAAQLAPQFGHLRDVDALVVDQDRAVRSRERRRELLEFGGLFGFADRHFSNP
jgi:hypothetical protein